MQRELFGKKVLQKGDASAPFLFAFALGMCLGMFKENGTNWN
jgi:hypothetical protein